jgi:hypothetical protein
MVTATGYSKLNVGWDAFGGGAGSFGVRGQARQAKRDPALDSAGRLQAGNRLGARTAWRRLISGLESQSVAQTPAEESGTEN